MKLSPSLLAAATTALHNPALLPQDTTPRIRRKVLTTEQEAIYAANRAEIDAELERRHEERWRAKQERAFKRLNAAELKRERKRERNRKLMEKQS